MRTVVALLREVRLARGMSRSELGRAAGCSRQYVEMLGSGVRVQSGGANRPMVAVTWRALGGGAPRG